MLATGGGDAVVKLWHDSTAEEKEEAFRKEVRHQIHQLKFLQFYEKLLLEGLASKLSGAIFVFVTDILRDVIYHHYILFMAGGRCFKRAGTRKCRIRCGLCKSYSTCI